MKTTTAVSVLLAVLKLIAPTSASSRNSLPVVINTWAGPFLNTTNTAFATLRYSTPLDAVEAGAAACQTAQCDGTVGYGGSPDEDCETTLDAMIMDGTTMNVGAVAGLKGIRNAVGVARTVLDRTHHSLLVGESAADFAVQMGFTKEKTATDESRRLCREWKANQCQPNFWQGVSPDPGANCGPYTPIFMSVQRAPRQHHPSHDTVSVLALGTDGTMASATSTNGVCHKIPGRVGDGPIPGSGSYVDGDVGACGATGDGDVLMRFLPCYQVVENMRRGMEPQDAAEDAVRRVLRKAPETQVGLVALRRDGKMAGAAAGWRFEYGWIRGNMAEAATTVVEAVTINDYYDVEL